MGLEDSIRKGSKLEADKFYSIAKLLSLSLMCYEVTLLLQFVTFSEWLHDRQGNHLQSTLAFSISWINGLN